MTNETSFERSLRTRRAVKSAISRFGAPKHHGDAVGLRPNHPALSEARTIFPSTVVAAADSPRLLVSGHNNPKLGAKVTKGPRAGWPIYHLTLEERATCPRTCDQWAGCYGNAMHLARRHRAGTDLERKLVEEVQALCARHTEGFIVRLHTLGDFYSLEYVALWDLMLETFAPLHAFGYTARGYDDPIGEAVLDLASDRWDRFAIRLSNNTGPQCANVFNTDPVRSDVLMCPAQTGASAACATCGLCWGDGARDKTIGFLRHGMRGGRRKA